MRPMIVEIRGIVGIVVNVVTAASVATGIAVIVPATRASTTPTGDDQINKSGDHQVLLLIYMKVCFNCNEVGHMKKNCPGLSGGPPSRLTSNYEHNNDGPSWNTGSGYHKDRSRSRERKD